MLKILLLLLFYVYAVADNVYFLPTNKNEALNKIITSISNAKQNINIAMYSFKNKTIAKKLAKIANKNISINIILDSKALNKKSRLHYLSNQKNIKTYTLQGAKRKNNKYYKMHSKYIIIDNKIVIFGSTNYSNDSFSGNYEVVYISNKKDIIEKFNTDFNNMIQVSRRYK
ncbi:membrane bound endonuclease (nuc) [hydrothermal vent metagenome]|uniref:Membrane bound endonuclease (Nuc) n=1 Tax=hydrothermal vent metagenome TaxID=652676 RepID=A0A3B1DWB7_9ZZZZ